MLSFERRSMPRPLERVVYPLPCGGIRLTGDKYGIFSHRATVSLVHQLANRLLGTYTP